MAGNWRSPSQGEAAALPDGRPRAWSRGGGCERRVHRRGHAFFQIQSADSWVAILNAAGHSMAYVNGEPQAVAGEAFRPEPRTGRMSLELRIRQPNQTVGGRTLQRDDIGCLFLQPRADWDTACVGVVAGRGINGLRVVSRLPYFMAGTGYPDCLVLGPETLQRGTAGVVAAGFFGNDWSVSAGDFAWGE